ncbi:DegT/DnrJ/EryC1/StrS family aminotransferase [uncultured Desulfobacter sp.]|uniref:DegT/DnrJ/EryC1/StrS family aminotransferase n=1 Tax=uncultured Desulfobacter sp. TaxID=240139 RepID=UPI002AA88EE9|nr:DegT/DnrJ/EryC1/StrS family aminotransferase [uncultured Desulfobacter sp.]
MGSLTEDHMPKILNYGHQSVDDTDISAVVGVELILLIPIRKLFACPHLYPIRLKAGAAKRRQVYERSKADNIFCQVHYIPIYLQPYYADKYGYEKGRCPQAELYYSQASFFC